MLIDAVNYIVNTRGKGIYTADETYDKIEAREPRNTQRTGIGRDGRNGVPICMRQFHEVREYLIYLIAFFSVSSSRLRSPLKPQWNSSTLVRPIYSSNNTTRTNYFSIGVRVPYVPSWYLVPLWRISNYSGMPMQKASLKPENAYRLGWGTYKYRHEHGWG